MSAQRNVELKFFQRLLWLDSNKNIKRQMGYLLWFFGEYLDFSFTIQEAKDFQLSRFERVLVMCSSKLIKQTYHTFLSENNFFPKMIVFCGSSDRAKQITSTSPYRQAILNAYYQEAAIVDAITTLDEKLCKDPGLMNLRVQIIENKYEEKKQYINQNQDQLTDRIEEKQPEGKKKKQKKGEKKKPKDKKEENAEQKKEVNKQKKEVNKQKKEANKVEEKKKYKLKQGVVLFFAVKDEQQEATMRKKIINDLEKAGINVQVYNFEDLRSQLQRISQKCTIISHASNQLEQLQSNANTLQLTIKFSDGCKKQEQTGQEAEVCLSTKEEVIKKLKDIEFIE